MESILSLQFPSLEYWDMLYMSSDEPTQLNERTNLEKSYTFEGEDYYKEN